MFGTKLRLVLIVLLSGFAVWSAADGLHSRAVIYLAGAAFLAWGYFRYGTVWLAWQEVRRGNTGRAAELLREVRHPSALSPVQRAYYGWATGYLALAERDYARARHHFDTVEHIRLRTTNDRSILACHRAQAAAGSGDLDMARSELERARSQPHKPGVDLLIDKIEKELPQADQP
jgi:outer membrane PBP1 activator LpoA protein